MQLIFRHVSGARSTDVDVVALGEHNELILGRANSAAVRFDSQRDSRVGRHHARITWRAASETTFLLTDLGSRNGTFVNGRRVDGSRTLAQGDVVQLGAGGPTVEIRWVMISYQLPGASETDERLDEEIAANDSTTTNTSSGHAP
jgi:pSer/pThr/pTyr-binding forkhead associated (FHA) protein